MTEIAVTTVFPSVKIKACIFIVAAVFSALASYAIYNRSRQSSNGPIQISSLNRSQIHFLLETILKQESQRLPDDFHYDFDRHIQYEIQEAYLIASSEHFANREKNQSGEQKDAIVTIILNWQDWNRKNLLLTAVLQRIRQGYVVRYHRLSTEFRPHTLQLHDFGISGNDLHRE